MGLNTCGALTGAVIEIPDGCGKLSKNGLKNNWLVVRKILEWIKGFFGFHIPGEQDMFAFTATGIDSIIIPIQSNFYPSNPTYTYPTDSTQYAFFDVYINGVMYPGGDENGMNAFTQEYAWNLQSTVDGFEMSFFDENDNPKTIGSEELPETIIVKFRPSLLVGSKFCTTNGSANPNDEPCNC